MIQINGIKVRENSVIARLAAWKLGASNMAITIGNTIHLHKASAEDLFADTRWLRHEMAHVEQFKRYGFFRFIGLYLLESMKKGYYRNRFEVEARRAEQLSNSLIS